MVSVALSGCLVIALVIGFAFGDFRSVRAIPRIAQFIPIDSQAFVVFPDFGKVLTLFAKEVDASAESTNQPRLVAGGGLAPSGVRDALNKWRSRRFVDGERFSATLSYSCRDLRNPSHLDAIGFGPSTAAAIISDRHMTSPWTDDSVFAIGPVNKDKFSRFLGELATNLIVAFSVEGPPVDHERTIEITNVDNSGLELCEDGASLAPLRAGSRISIAPGYKYATKFVIPLTNASATSSTNVQCRFLNGNGTCRCSVFELIQDRANLLGDCTTKTPVAKLLAPGAAIRKTAESAAPLETSLPVFVPFFGPIDFGGTSNMIRWEPKSQTFLFGAKDLLDGNAVYSGLYADGSVQRSDTFIRGFELAAKNGEMFVGLLRSEQLNLPDFSRLLSLPMQFVGRITGAGLRIRALMNLEPLDARILQDISRDVSLSDKADIAVRSGAGNALVKVRDDKVGQYLVFADRYVLNRLIESASSLSLDPNLGVELLPAQYFLTKLGLTDDYNPRQGQLFVEHPHEFMFFDDDLSAATPGIAVAIKFNSGTRDFICREYRRTTEDFDRRILINAARNAKQSLNTDGAGDVAQDALAEQMTRLLGSEVWARLTRDYEIEFSNLGLADKEGREVLSDQACRSAIYKVRLNGEDREVYFLTPAFDENAKKYYYRFPEIDAAVQRAAAAFQQEIIKINLDRAQIENISRAGAIAERIRQQASKLGNRTLSAGSLKLDLNQLNVALKAADPDQIIDWRGGSAAALVKLIDDAMAPLESFARAFEKGASDAKAKLASVQERARRIKKAAEAGDLRLVAVVDDANQTIYMASGLRSLERALLGRPPSNAKSGDNELVEGRIRFVATGDTAARAAISLAAAPVKALQWRSNSATGRILPWRRVGLGISGYQNGVAIDLELSR